MSTKKFTPSLLRHHHTHLFTVFLLFLLFFPLTGSAQPTSATSQPLPAHDVFQLETTLHDPNTLVLTWRVKEGYFLYKDRIKVALLSKNIAKLGNIVLPKGELKQHAQGQDEILRDTVNLSIPLLGLKKEQTLLSIHYQGCSDSGFCYPPTTETLKLSLDPQRGIVSFSTLPQASATLTPTETPAFGTLQHTEQLLSHGSLVLTMISFFAFGILLSFTPCVLPMLPIISGIILRHQTPVTSKKAFFLSLTYVLSMATTYALLGILAASIGRNLQVSLQQPWALVLFSGLFILLALSMFGWYDLRLPARLEAKINHLNKHPIRGAYLSTALMGCLATLLLSPCVTAPLAGALIYIAEHGNIILGALALFSLGLGIGFPLLLLVTYAATLLPKAGEWMNAIKIFFGLLLLAVAISILQRIIPAPFPLLLWGALLILASLYLQAFTFTPETRFSYFRQSLGLVAFVYATLLIIGATMGNVDPLRPLTGINPEFQPPSHTMQTITTLKEAKTALNTAKASSKTVMIDFYADWCTACKIMEHQLKSQPMLQQALASFILLKADVTAINTETQALLRYFKVIAPPTYIFYDTSGEEVTAARIVGEVDTDYFLQQLRKVKNTNK